MGSPIPIAQLKNLPKKRTQTKIKQVMFCTKCGNQIKDGFKFCPKCGTPVYVEKEISQSEVKAQVEIIEEETSNKKLESQKNVKSEDTTKPKGALSSKETTSSSSTNQSYIPNPLIEKLLDTQSLIMKANNQDYYAIKRLAFRYNFGIGVEMDHNKAISLYNQIKEEQNVMLIDIPCHQSGILPKELTYGLIVKK